MIFQALDPALDAIGKGTLFREWSARLLETLGGLQATVAVLMLLTTLAGGLPRGGTAVLGLLLFAVFTCGAWYAAACISFYRARAIRRLPESSRMISWVLIHLVRMGAEQSVAFCFLFGAGSFFSLALVGNSGYLGLGSAGFFGGLVSLMAFWALGASIFITLVLFAEVFSAAIETADVLRSNAVVRAPNWNAAAGL